MHMTDSVHGCHSKELNSSATSVLWIWQCWSLALKQTGVAWPCVYWHPLLTSWVRALASLLPTGRCLGGHYCLSWTRRPCRSTQAALGDHGKEWATIPVPCPCPVCYWIHRRFPFPAHCTGLTKLRVEYGIDLPTEILMALRFLAIIFYRYCSLF